MTPVELTNRVERLEASVAHLERLADQLNEAIIGQGRDLGRLQKRLEQIAETTESREIHASAQTVERPPHYGR